jgi:hypothetical protein
LSLLLLPNLAMRTQHGWREVLTIDLPLFFGTTLSIASFYLASEREIKRMTNPGSSGRFQWLGEWKVWKRLPLVMSLGIGLCVNQTRAVLEALMGRETEFVRTPKHGIKGRLESWSGKKYRAAKSLTPVFELGLAAYFVVAVVFAFKNGHYLSVPFLMLFLCGFAYVGGASVSQGRFGAAVRRLFAGAPTSRPTEVIPPPFLALNLTEETAVPTVAMADVRSGMVAVRPEA